MPHKHKRKATQISDVFDLPPTSTARSLPVGKVQSRDAEGSNNSGNARKRRRTEAEQDDTPKAFKRLMQFKRTGTRPSGLDDGTPRQHRSQEKDGSEKKQQHGRPAKKQTLRIKPNESMSEFASRVDQELPIAGLTRKSKKIEGMRAPQTQLEKKIQRRQNAWREELKKLQDQDEEARDLAELDEAENWGSSMQSLSNRGGKRGKKSKRGHGNDAADDSRDPWAVLKAKRGTAPKLHEVAQAPPEFKRVPREAFKIKNNAKVDVANVPAAAGSLRKREDLGQARKNVIENYRKIMSARKNAAG